MLAALDSALSDSISAKFSAVLGVGARSTYLLLSEQVFTPDVGVEYGLKCWGVVASDLTR